MWRHSTQRVDTWNSLWARLAGTSITRFSVVTINHTLAKIIHTNELQEYFLQKHTNLNRKTLSPDEACMFLNFVAQFSWSTGDMSVPSHIAFYSFVFFSFFFFLALALSTCRPCLTLTRWLLMLRSVFPVRVLQLTGTLLLLLSCEGQEREIKMTKSRGWRK